MTFCAVKNYTIGYKTNLDGYYSFRSPKNSEKLNRIEKYVMLTEKNYLCKKNFKPKDIIRIMILSLSYFVFE